MSGSARSVEDWLHDIVLWGEKLAQHIDGMTREQFLGDAKTQDAACKCAEAIGLAASEILKLAPDFDVKHPELRLPDAYKSRNRLSHGYFKIDLSLLWNTVANSVPDTIAAAKLIIHQGRSEP